jgi:hypothetical protein
MLLLLSLPVLPEAKAALGKSAVAAAAAELIAAVLKNSLLVLISIASKQSQRAGRYSRETR